MVRSGVSTEFGVFRGTGDIAISDDGRYVVVTTAQKVLTVSPGSSYSTALAYRKDIRTGELLGLGTGQTGSWEHRVAVDPSGRYGVYSTISADVPDDKDFHTDVYRRDLQSGALTLVTSRSDGSATPTAVNGSVDAREYGYVVALTGEEVIVTTLQALDVADTNRVMDAYRRDVAGSTATYRVASPGRGNTRAGPHGG